MAKLYFKYGTMESGKSTKIIQEAYNYDRNNKSIIVAKPIIDSKGNDKIVSRIGIQRKIDVYIESDNLKEIYEKLELHPYWNVRNYEVKAVNTAIGSFLRKDINVQNENFQNLHDYILYLQTNVTGRRLRNTNFDTLRNIMRTEYPAEQVYF